MVWVNVHRALRDGICFHESPKDGAILCDGDGDEGSVPPAYFSVVVELCDGLSLTALAPADPETGEHSGTIERRRLSKGGKVRTGDQVLESRGDYPHAQPNNLAYLRRRTCGIEAGSHLRIAFRSCPFPSVFGGAFEESTARLPDS